MSAKAEAAFHPYPVGVRVFETLEQGSDEWLSHRCGIVTASVVGQLITKGAPDPLTIGCPNCYVGKGDPCVSTARKEPTPIKTIHKERTERASALPPVFTVADNDTSRALILNLAAERITGYVEESPTSKSMERGQLDEPYARFAYADHVGTPVKEVGFMLRQYDGYTLGYSPDGLVNDDGLIEIKSRNQRIHLRTILEGRVPAANMAQVQTGLLVSGRDWCDYVSYCGGMPLLPIRVHPEPAWFDAILRATEWAESAISNIIATYDERRQGLPLTDRINHFPELEFTF
ncbi:lambda exonuclease family protein [Arthrobacter sp. MDT1-65]